MKALDQIYTRRFFGRMTKEKWRSPIVCGAINSIIKPKKVVDVGCGIGDQVKGWIDLGVDAFGLEGAASVKEFLEVPEDLILFHDLRKPLPDWIDNVDLVTCFEVAEHIEEEHADQFVANLIALGAPKILISAAPPGQRGHYHVNCQPYEYWTEKFSAYSYDRILPVEEELKKALAPWRKKSSIKNYYKNLLYFWKG